MTDILNYYKVLQANISSSEEELKQQYRNLAKIWHPDYSKEPNAIDVFQQISVAYDVLSDPAQKMFYDVFCVAYKKTPAPDMKLLSVYKNQKGKEDLSLRVLNVYKKNKVINVICSESEAFSVALKALLNIKNYTINLINKEENLQMLLHNALAYSLEKNNKMIEAYASQSLLFANKEEQTIILKWLNSLNLTQKSVKSWNYKKLSSLRFLPLGLFLLLGLFFSGTTYVNTSELWKHFEKNKEIDYYQKVEYSSGRQSVDDMDIGRVINYPVNLYDDNMLYHLTQNIDIKYAPAEEFDTLSQGVIGQTVRITGLTPDEIWVRIMIDDGQVGFVKKAVVKKGIKNKIPNNSKIK